MKRGQRSIVSTEEFRLYNKKAAFKPRVILKKVKKK